MNVERLLKVRNTILERPDRTMMHSYHYKGKHDILGWAQVLFSPRWRDRAFNGTFMREMSLQEQCDLLEAEYHEIALMNNISRWPLEERRAYQMMTTDWARSEAIARRIDRFIEEHQLLNAG